MTSTTRARPGSDQSPSTWPVTERRWSRWAWCPNRDDCSTSWSAPLSARARPCASSRGARGRPTTWARSCGGAEGSRSMNVAAMGRVGLKGWRAKMSQRVAPAVAQRTPLDEEQIITLIGWAFLALYLWQTLKFIQRLAEAAREVE